MFLTTNKQSLGQGSVLTPVSHSVQGGRGLNMMSLLAWLPSPIFLLGPTAAGPGFPPGGGGGGRQHTILPNFPENCMKSKEFGRLGGGRAPRAPLNPPLRGSISGWLVLLFSLCCVYEINIKITAQYRTCKSTTDISKFI